MEDALLQLSEVCADVSDEAQHPLANAAGERVLVVDDQSVNKRILAAC